MTTNLSKNCTCETPRASVQSIPRAPVVESTTGISKIQRSTALSRPWTLVLAKQRARHNGTCRAIRRRPAVGIPAIRGRPWPSVDDLGPSVDSPFTRAHTSDTRMLECTLSTFLSSPSLNSSARVLLAGEPHSPTLSSVTMNGPSTINDGALCSRA